MIGCVTLELAEVPDGSLALRHNPWIVIRFAAHSRRKRGDKLPERLTSHHDTNDAGIRPVGTAIDLDLFPLRFVGIGIAYALPSPTVEPVYKTTDFFEARKILH